MKVFIGRIYQDRDRLLRAALLVALALYVLRSCLLAAASSLPPEVHEQIDRQYGHCLEVRGSEFVGGNQLEGECSRATTQVVGEGRVPAAEHDQGVTRAICYRVLVETPYFWAQSGTQYEEIDFARRSASKVTVLQDGVWLVFPDQDGQDRELWARYACPGEYEEPAG